MWSIFPRLLLSFYKSIGGLAEWLTTPVDWPVRLNLGTGFGLTDLRMSVAIAPIELITATLVTTIALFYVMKWIIIIKQAFWPLS